VHDGSSAPSLHVIADGLSSFGAKANTLAAELHITERTLHRRVGEEGIIFSEILDKLRSSVAEKYLSERRPERAPTTSNHLVERNSSRISDLLIIIWQKWLLIWRITLGVTSQ
jgi:AraC-like DNA-binding protein